MLSHGDSLRGRRGLLQRSDTAPEDLELERRLEWEWRRRTFSRGSSAERPASAMPPRTSYTLPVNFSYSCSASCPPTVPTTPTRSPRSLHRAPLIPPPPLTGLRSCERIGGSGILAPGPFQCDCLDERDAWRWQPGADMWCMSCSKKRCESSAWGSMELGNSLPSHQLSSAALLSHTPDCESLAPTMEMPPMDLTRELLRIRQPMRTSSFWDCFILCRESIGHRLARKRIEQGVRLYNQQKHLAAVNKWKQALRRMQRDNDRFIALGYLSQAHYEWGRYREMLDFGFQQLDIANAMNSSILRAEAYLSLAKGNFRLGHLEKALSYCRHSLYCQCDQSKTTGFAHLILGNIYSVYSSFSKALEHYELALKISRVIPDAGLELQSYCGLGGVFCLLQDFEKALSFSAKAFELSKSFHICDLNCKYQRLSLVALATPLRKMGRFHEAKDCCQDALKLALAAGDRPTHARCLTILADIYRQCLDVQRSYKRYETAMNLMMNLEDKHGQLITLNGIAKVLGLMRRQSKICDCRPLEINKKVLDLASSIGCKLLLRSAHIRLAELYHVLNDEENEGYHERMSQCLTEEMELVCGACHEQFGDTHGNSLDALSCSHIFHAKCVRDLMMMSGDRKKKRICPECQKSFSSRMLPSCYDDMNNSCGDGLYGSFGHYRRPSFAEQEQPL